MKPVSKNKAHGRGQQVWIKPRYASEQRDCLDDGWWQEEETGRLETTVMTEKVKTIISRNSSPDIPFEQSINPYRGCEHGCTYCYARPAHAYMDLSPGIDFETRLFAKPNAAEILEKQLAQKNYQCSPIALGANTDPYQPIEQEYKITRDILEVLNRYDHPLTIVTKSSMIVRDLDLLEEMARKDLVEVMISVTTLDAELARQMEPRAAAPWKRIRTIKQLHDASVPVGVMFAPVIPALNDTEMETVLEQATTAGATRAGYVLLRLPHEVRPLFRQWLQEFAPLKYNHVMHMLNDMRGGKDYDADFRQRQTGAGPFADIISQRFSNSCRRLGLNKQQLKLNTTNFIRPVLSGQQITMF